MSIIKDNALELGKDKKGWFIGHFMDNPELKSEDVEIHYVESNKGYKKESAELNPKVKTVVILIKGCFEITFLKEKKKVILEKPGDFVKYTGSKHVGLAIEDSQIVTIRWPSIK